LPEFSADSGRDSDYESPQQQASQGYAGARRQRDEIFGRRPYAGAWQFNKKQQRDIEDLAREADGASVLDEADLDERTLLDLLAPLEGETEPGGGSRDSSPSVAAPGPDARAVPDLPHLPVERSRERIERHGNSEL
jgi:hypothetical protein